MGAKRNTETIGEDIKEEVKVAADKEKDTKDTGQQTPKSESMEKEKMIYIGPSLPGAMLKSNTVFDGTREEIKKELAGVFEKFPLAEKMLVPVSGLAEKKNKVKTAGNILNKYYSDLVSASYSTFKKEE